MWGTFNRACPRQSPVFSTAFSMRYESSYWDLVSSKGLDGAVKLSEAKFWDTQYSRSDYKKTEWYINGGQAASFLAPIILQRKILHPTKLNILLEIGCGTAPVVLPLIEKMGRHFGTETDDQLKRKRKMKKTADIDESSRYKVLGFATDASNVCVSELISSHAEHVSALREPKQVVYRSDGGQALSYLSRGVFCKVLDIKDFKSFCQDLQYFPIRNINLYKSQVDIDDWEWDNYRTNIIVLDKGCLDALIWDKNVDLVKNVLDYSDAVLSISGEDPDIRLGYFQTQFGKLFSVHFSKIDGVYGYSFSSSPVNC